MTKINVTFSIEKEMYDNFKVECIRKKVKFGEQIEKFMTGYSQNNKIVDYLTYEEARNPKLDVTIEEMNEFISKISNQRCQELFWKADEWKTRLDKK